jgi:hypothetical protein
MRSLRRTLPALILLALLFLVAVATQAASAAQTPFVRVSPSSGMAGSQANVSGEFFQPGHSVELFFDDQSHSLGVTAVRPTGRISANVTIPTNAVPGPHVIFGVSDGQQTAPADFQVESGSESAPG